MASFPGAGHVCLAMRRADPAAEAEVVVGGVTQHVVAHPPAAHRRGSARSRQVVVVVVRAASWYGGPFPRPAGNIKCQQWIVKGALLLKN